MSAVEEYRKFSYVVQFGGHILPEDVAVVREVFIKMEERADAAIAELEAEVAALRGELDYCEGCGARLGENPLAAELFAARQAALTEGVARGEAKAELAEMTTYRDNARQQMEWLRDERDTARSELAALKWKYEYMALLDVHMAVAAEKAYQDQHKD